MEDMSDEDGRDVRYSTRPEHGQLKLTETRSASPDCHRLVADPRARANASPPSQAAQAVTAWHTLAGPSG